MIENAPTNCVIGSGSLGLAMATLLSQRSTTWLLSRSSDQELQTNSGINLIGDLTLSTKASNYKVIASNQLGSLSSKTRFWSCVKGYDLEQLIEQLTPYLNEHSELWLMQNGIGVFFDVASKIKQRSAIIRLIPETGFLKVAPNQVRISGSLHMSLSVPDYLKGRLPEFQALLDQLGIQNNVATNIAQAEWNKVALNCIVNPLASLANSKNKVLYENPLCYLRACNMIRELKLVAEKDGFSIPSEEQLFAKIKNIGENICSTLQDLRAAKRSEMEYMLGRVLKIADAYGLDTPNLREVWLEWQVYERKQLKL